MANKHRATALLRDNHSILEIAKELAIGISTLKQYLYVQVGEGALKRSDILFSIPESERQAIEDAIQQTGTATNFYAIGKGLNSAGYSIDQEIVRIYLDLRDARVSMGDMYELISVIEITLHDFVKQTLVKEFGAEENGWWRKGVPQQIRTFCVSARETDPEPAEEPYCYTNFIHLEEIIEKQWAVFSRVLPPDIVRQKKIILNGLGNLNHIRNSIMHPIKRLPITENDFSFVKHYSEIIDILFSLHTGEDNG